MRSSGVIQLARRCLLVALLLVGAYNTVKGRSYEILVRYSSICPIMLVLFSFLIKGTQAAKANGPFWVHFGHCSSLPCHVRLTGLVTRQNRIISAAFGSSLK